MTHYDQNTRSYDQDSHSRGYDQDRRSGNGHHSYWEAGDWLMSTARRNPEAVLVLAAGVALLLRGGHRSSKRYRAAQEDRYGSRYPLEENRGASMDVYQEGQYQEDGGRSRRSPVRAVRESIASVAETASEYASDVTERVYETAGAYASTVSEYADAGRRRLADQASWASRQAYRAGSQAGQMLHEQPVAVAALGLATGAAVAALLPRVEMEERALRPARNALADAAGRAVESVKEAASDAGKRLQEKAADLGAEALKDAAKSAVQSFASGASGSSDQSAQRTGGTGSSGGGVA